MTKITSLTDEQKEKCKEYAEKWIEVGLDTSEIDIEESLSALKEAYENVNMTFPEKYEVYDSPSAAIKAMKDKYNQDVTPNDFIYGAHDSPWVAFYNYFDEVLGLNNIHDKINPFVRLAKSCGWVLLFDEMVVLTRKPIHLKFDNQNRAHCDHDFAIKFKDNTGVTVWHGQAIPQEWIFNQESIDAEILLRWENIEQRRCACEIVGWAKVLEHLKSEVLDKDDDPTIGTLYEIELPDSGKEKLLVAIDPNTDKPVGLPVPAEVNTAREANSWTYGIEAEEFKPEFRV